MASIPPSLLEAALRQFPPQSGIRIDQDGKIYPPAPQTAGTYHLTLSPDRIEIPAYDEQSLEKLIPGILERIGSEKGQILFMNFGFSTLPLVSARKYLKTNLREPPVIVNGFDISQVREDLLNLQEFLGGEPDVDIRRLNKYSFAYRFQAAVNNVEALSAAIQDGILIPVVYDFGSGCFPLELMEANLAISPYNPLAGGVLQSSLHEQLATLAPGGELYTKLADWKLEGLEPGFQVRPINTFEGLRVANIIRRES